MTLRERDEQPLRSAARRVAGSPGYEALPESTDDHGDVESFQAIDARLREAFRWLEKAITYLNGLKPPIEHRFDLGYGFVIRFAAVRPRFGRSARAPPHPRLPGARSDRRLLRGFRSRASVDRGGPRVGLVCREDPRCVRAAIHLPPRGRFRRDAAANASFQSRP